MKKALLVASRAGFIAGFEKSNVKLLQDMDYEVHVLGDFDMESCSNKEILGQLLQSGIVAHDVKICRNPLEKQNITAYKEIKKIVKSEKFDLVHCHTPAAGVMTRLACRKLRKKGLKVIYTAHGFHFCKVAPLKNWLLYYPVEWVCAHWTDVLVTINEEDYVLAQKHMHARRVEYVPGVGIDLEKFAPNAMTDAEKSAKRASLGLRDEDTVFLSVGAVYEDKNHILMIKAMQRLKNENYRYIVCGRGPLQEEFEKYLRDNGLEKYIKFLGYRKDITEILQITDVFVFPSTFEGLSVALMEAIASKVIAICSASRGNTDLVKDKRCLFDYRSVEQLVQAIRNVEGMSADERNAIIEDNYSRLLPREKSAVSVRMKEIYKETEAMGI